MATKGIKRIHFNNVGREGINNSLGLSNLETVNIAHPQGLASTQETQTNPQGLGSIIGGNHTYNISSTTKLNTSYILTTDPTNKEIFQNIYPDVFFTASVDPDRNHIPTLWIADSEATRYTTSSVQAYQWAFQPRNRNTGNTDGIYFKNHVSGNEAGWWEDQSSIDIPPYFELKELPNTTFKVTLDLWFKGKNADNSPLTESIYAGVFSKNTGRELSTIEQNDFNDKIYPLGQGYLPVQTVLVSASENVYQNHTFEFMVTQSYSRLSDKPIGPEYAPTYNFFRGSPRTETENVKWYININGGWDWYDTSDLEYTHSSSKELIAENPYRSTIKIEPVSIIRNDITYGYPGANYALINNTGSVIQPPTTLYQNIDIGNPAGTDASLNYNAGDVVNLNSLGIGKVLVLYDNLGPLNYGILPTDNAKVAGNIQFGRLSVVEPRSDYDAGSLWDQGYESWRYQSLITTSSIVPIDNTVDVFSVSDDNAVINNGSNGRLSSIYYDIDYSNGIEEPVNIVQIKQQSAVYAAVPDSNYSSRGWSSIRYKGSRISSPGVNKT
jgi:hypothetical protein